MNAPASQMRAGDVRVMSLIGLGHATSHFFHLMIPSLFPWLMADFGLSFTRAGTLTAAFFIISGTGQALAGFVVDRYGALRTLSIGIALLSLSAFALSLAHGYPALVAAALLAGAGNAVFHPADFTVLNHSVSPSRLSHAFSAHGLAGNLGWAASPVFMAGLATFAGWRVAAIAAGMIALGALASIALLLRGAAGPAPDHPHEVAAPRASPFELLRVGAIWMCFVFFLASTMGVGALQNFAPPVLKNVYGLPLTAGASALSLYLLAGAVGIAAGGFLAARYQTHERVVALLLTGAALMAVVLASAGIPGAAVAPLMAGIGFCTGTAAPSRHPLVPRTAVDRFGQRSFGRVYGFVYSGLDTGLSVAPVLLGPLMDRGMFSAVLYAVALFQGLAVLAALRVGHARMETAAALQTEARS